MPKLSELAMIKSFEKFTCTECVPTPIPGAIEILLKVALAKSIPKKLKDFFEKHRNN